MTVPTTRRSWVAAPFIAEVSEARSWCSSADTPALSICTRCIDP